MNPKVKQIFDKLFSPIASDKYYESRPEALENYRSTTTEGAHLIALHLAFAGEDVEAVDIAKQKQKGGANGVRNFASRGFSVLPTHASVKAPGPKGLVGSGRTDAGGMAIPDGALKFYFAMNERDGDDGANKMGMGKGRAKGKISEKAMAARKWWVGFLKEEGLDNLSVEGDRTLLDPYAFHDQWTYLHQINERGDAGGLEQLHAEITDFKSPVPAYFNKTPGNRGDSLIMRTLGDLDGLKERTTEKAQRVKAVIAVEKKTLAANNFREQLMLMANIENMVSQAADQRYNNFYYLRNHDPSQALENEVYAFKGKKDFLEITNLQVSALVPYFKMFLIIGKGPAQKEFQIPLQGTFASPDEILKFGRTRTLGFQDFSWTYEGKYLETAKKQIEANLSLYGDNLGVFEKEIGVYDPGAQGRSFFQQMAPQPSDSVSKGPDILSYLPPKRTMKYEDLLVRSRDIAFKVQCGWAVPHGTPEDLISTSLKSAIQSNIVTLIMELVEHTFEFQQDGTFSLNLRYKSRIMGSLDSINLLQPREGKKRLSKEQKKFNLDVKRKFNKHLSMNPTSKTEDKDDNEKIKSDVFTDAELKDFADRNFPPAKRAEAYTEIKNFLTSGNLMDHRKRAARVVSQMIANKNNTRTGKNFSQILTDIENRGRQFYVAVSQSQFRQYFNQSQADLSMRDALNQISGELSDKERKAERDRIILFYEEKKKAAKGNIAKKAIIGERKRGDNSFEKLSAADLNTRDLGGGTFKLPFFYFGDLVESALNMAGAEFSAEDVSIILGTMPFKKNVTQTLTMPLTDFKTSMVEETVVQLPLVDVPISVRNYSAWIHNEYIKKPTSNVQLSSFIIGAFNNLIRPAFSGESDLVKLLDSQKTTLAVNVNTFTSDKRIKKANKEITIPDLNGLAVSNNPKTKSNMHNFVLFTSNQIVPKLKKPTATEALDGKTIALTLGRDRGLVKTANFSKVSMPNVVAARFMMDSGADNGLDKIKEPYDVDLTMVGNNLFSQGVNFWLQPTVPGEEGRRAAQALGLGGYYVTTQASMKIDMMSGFTTTLHGKLQNFSEVPANVQRLVAKKAADANKLAKQRVK